MNAPVDAGSVAPPGGRGALTAKHKNLYEHLKSILTEFGRADSLKNIRKMEKVFWPNRMMS